jgi:hypothetical protein
VQYCTLTRFRASWVASSSTFVRPSRYGTISLHNLKEGYETYIDQSLTGASVQYQRPGPLPVFSIGIPRDGLNDSACATLLTSPDGLRSASVPLQKNRSPRQADLRPHMVDVTH